MSCYNGKAYIEEAIVSVKKQSYPNIELIIIDDGYDDLNTVTILKKLVGAGVKLLHTVHIGPAGVRNTGIVVAKGKCILPLDADDTMDAKTRKAYSGDCDAMFMLGD